MNNKVSLIIVSMLWLLLMTGCHNVCYEEYKQCAGEECKESYALCCEMENCPGYSRLQQRAREDQ